MGWGGFLYVIKLRAIKNHYIRSPDDLLGNNQYPLGFRWILFFFRLAI